MTEDVSKIVASYHDRISALEADFAQLPANPNDKEWVKAKLRHMVEIDQISRSLSGKSELREHILPRAIAIDEKNTAALKELIDIWGWFTISQFGEQADSDAWLLAQHADLDHDFQVKVLGVLEKLYPQGETKPAHYAYLYDRVAVSFVFNNNAVMGLQRYGTQLTRDAAGNWQPCPVEDPDHLDERRQQMGLKPMADYLNRKP